MMTEEMLLSKFQGCSSCPFSMDSSPPCTECQVSHHSVSPIKKADSFPLDINTSAEDPWFINLSEHKQKESYQNENR